LNTRLEHTLVKLARRYAPALVPATWRKPGDYPRPLSELAAALANYNLLVMTGDVPALVTDYGTQVSRWVEGYARLYDLLARTLFPSFAQVSAHYADEDVPPIVIMIGTATPVIVMLARYIAPYIVARQNSDSVSEFELHGVMDLVLEELEAGDLPREEYRQLRDDGAALLRQMLGATVIQRRVAKPHHSMASAFSLDEPPQESAAAPHDTQTPAPHPPFEEVAALPTDQSPFPPSVPPMPLGDLPLSPSVPMTESTPPTASLPVTDVPPKPPMSLPEESSIPALTETTPNEPVNPPVNPDAPNPFGATIPVFYDARSRGRRPPPVPDLPEDIP
jgi:hypothetical protein